jgi:hypothetical protein
MFIVLSKNIGFEENTRLCTQIDTYDKRTVMINIHTFKDREKQYVG